MYNKNHVALTPPMGWNSWDCYAATVTEEQLLGNAEYMAKNLKQYGWEYIVCDIQWSDPLAGTTPSEYIPLTTLCMDEYGRLIPAVERFPSAANGVGFRAIADKIHAMGLKFGIHIMRGVPRQAAHAHAPVYGLPGVTCDKIADPFSICAWNSDMYGVRATPEGQAYYDSLFQLYAQWQVDYVKVDDIANLKVYPSRTYGKEEVEMIAKAIERCGRPMVLSLSPGPALIEESWHLSEYANMWRMTDDFWDGWPQLKDMFRRCEIWQAHVKPGCWPDCDMLPLGKIGMGWKKGRTTNFTKEEQRTLMTLWCIFRAPLMMGGELRENDEWTLSLLTNADVLRLLPHSHGARQIAHNNSMAAWHSFGDDGSEYLALFNLSDAQAEIGVPETVWSKQPVIVRELWGRNALLKGDAAAVLSPHDAVLLRAEF